MPTLDYSPAAQTARREQLRRRHRETVRDIRSVTIEENSPRSRMWEALAWLGVPGVDQEAVAQYLLGPDPWGPCAFCPCVSMQLLIRADDTMPAGLRAHLEQYAQQYLDHERGARYAGFNDNFPAMSAACLALAGAYFADDQWSRAAETVLASALELLARRDYFSEYLSTTYSPLTLAMSAEMANLSADATVREMAAELERRSWTELLRHWHAPSCSLAGPHARSYECDSVSHVTLLNMLFWGCFGSEIIPINSYDWLYPPRPELVIHHEGDVDFMRCHAIWHTATEFHVPAEPARLLLDPALPRTEIGWAEGGCFRDIVPPEAGFDPPWHGLPYPMGPNRLTSHLSPSFTLGTAHRDWLNGDQQDAFIFKAVTAHHGPQPARSIFARYVSGDKIPGEDNYYPDMKKHSTKDLLHEEGRRHCLQSCAVAVVAYWPKRRLEKTPTGKLGLEILIPCHFSVPDEIWLGDTRLGEGTAELSTPAPLFLREGEAFLALLPLAVDDAGRTAAVRAERRGKYFVMEYLNYEGEQRQFTQPELLPVRNGFVAIAEESAGRDFARWRRAVAQTIPRDMTMYNNETREIEVEYGETHLKMRLNHATESVQFATVNGVNVE
jgi:hypothetical protein